MAAAAPHSPAGASGDVEILTASVDPPLPAAIVNGTLTDDYPTVGIVNNGCTGTLISPRHVLTAAHCTDDTRESRGAFQIGGETVRTTEQIEHPQYNENSLVNDIAIMVLGQSVDDITPSEILRERPVVGEMLTLVGYGDGGTTLNPLRDFPTKRVGQTPLEVITSNQLRWTFDGFGESNTATGDSGGPAFVQRGADLLVAGVTSGGDGDPWNRFGDIDHAWETRVDVFADWIDSIVGGTTPEPQPDDHLDEPGIGATKIPLIASQGWESGALQFIGDRDAFRFRLTEQSRVSLIAASRDGSLDTLLRLYGADGQLIQSNDDLVSGSNRNSRIIRTLAAGTYFVTVGAFDDDSVGLYSIVVDLGNEPSGDQHANEPDESATTLQFDSDGHTAISGRLDSFVDRDVFSFSLGQPSPVTIAAVATDGRLDPLVRLYDATGRQLESNDDGPVTTDSLLEANLQPGMYFASVASFDASSSGTFVLSIQTTPEPIDYFAGAVKTTLDQYGRALIQGSVGEPSGFTTYTFTSRFNGSVRAATRANDELTDTRIVVFDADRKELASASDRSLTNLDSFVEFDVRENERYYVVVQGEAGTVGDYRLTLRTVFSLKEKAAASLSPNDSLAARSAKSFTQTASVPKTPLPTDKVAYESLPKTASSDHGHTAGKVARMACGIELRQYNSR